MKTLYIATVTLIFLIIAGIFISAQYKSPNIITNYSPSFSPTPVLTNKPTPVSKPLPIQVSGCGTGGACTATQVAIHNKQSDCWVYLNPINKVYNITAYVADSNTHPGGNVIVPFCGTNIYDYFLSNANGGRRHSDNALNNILQAYYIGPLAR